jgi:hypothetical protein
MARRPGHPCDLSPPESEAENKLRSYPKVKLEDACDFCRLSKAAKVLKTKDGARIRLCKECYEEETKSRLTK